MTTIPPSRFEPVKTFILSHKTPIFWILGTSLGVFFFILGIAGTFFYSYQGVIYPNIFVADIPLEGLTRNEARDLLQKKFHTMLDQGVHIRFDEETQDLDLRVSGSSDPDLTFDLVDFDADHIADLAYSLGRTGTWNQKAQDIGNLFFKPENIPTDIHVLSNELSEVIETSFRHKESSGEDTKFVITEERNERILEVALGTEGSHIDTETALRNFTKDVQDFHIEPLTLELIPSHDVITQEEAESLFPTVEVFLDNVPYLLNYTTDLSYTHEWKITEDLLSTWIKPERTDLGIEVVLNEEALEDFLLDIEEDVNIDPQNARFNMQDGRVTEFAGSHEGVRLDREKTMEEIEAHLGIADSNYTIITENVAPAITTGSVNDLGITEVLGVGISDFSGSPWNRIQNIKHGASKLNGLLIAPGETISLVDQLKPFTVADGYLPELVIKGDEIKAEVGGGLCQIGTTTFRAAMNTGLEIVERRNHSLVVNYYNDPTNGNPGTDATIYDPSPDFKFRNDMEGYILLTTEVDEANRELVFTFWGTSDGRKGYYTPPVVLSWQSYGPTEYKDTESLAPGVTECQLPHPGATTSFDYYVDYANGETFTKNYTSVYRSLPRICLVGISPDAETTDESDATASEEETIVSSDTSVEESAMTRPEEAES